MIVAKLDSRAPDASRDRRVVVVRGLREADRPHGEQNALGHHL